jgi:hypothetical protein
MPPMAKADPAKSAGIARATAANNSAALTVAFVNAGVLKTPEAAVEHFWKFYGELMPELAGDNAGTPARWATPAGAPHATPIDAAERAVVEGLGGERIDEPRTDAASTIVKFGKYKGQTIAQIFASDRDYAEKILLNSNNDFIKRLANEYAAGL